MINAKLSQLSIGDVIIADGGFTCMPASRRVVERNSDGDLFVKFAHGCHILDGQLDFEDHDTLVGFTLPESI